MYIEYIKIYNLISQMINTSKKSEKVKEKKAFPNIYYMKFHGINCKSIKNGCLSQFNT